MNPLDKSVYNQQPSNSSIVCNAYAWANYVRTRNWRTATHDNLSNDTQKFSLRENGRLQCLLIHMFTCVGTWPRVYCSVRSVWWSDHPFAAYVSQKKSLDHAALLKPRSFTFSPELKLCKPPCSRYGDRGRIDASKFGLRGLGKGWNRYGFGCRLAGEIG